MTENSPTAHRPASRLAAFYALVLTQTFSLIGSRMTSVAVGIFIFRETGQAAPLLLISFFNELPGMLGGGLAGVLVDRWNRKLVMILADLGQAAGSVLLIASFLSGAFQLWHVYAVAFLQGVFATLQGPAESATVTLMVPEGHRDRANAIMELGFPLASVLAPVLTGLVYASIGVTGVLAVDLGTFVIAACVLLVLAIPQPVATDQGSAGRGSVVSEWRTGFAFLRRHRPLLIFIVYFAFGSFMLNGPLDLVIPYFLSATGSETQMGFGLTIMALGTFAGGLLIAVFSHVRPRMKLIAGGAVLTGVMFLVFGLARALPVMAAALFLLMLPLPANNALYKSIFQLKVPADMQGRVFAFAEQLFLLGSTTSFLLTGALVDRVLTPLASAPGGWPLGSLLGKGHTGAIGLVEVVTGIVLLVGAEVTFSIRSVRRMEAELPDYEYEARGADTET
ncbi:MAG: MFS transporter [Nitrososphaerales archaeon]